MREMLYQRDVYGQTLVELGKMRQDVVVMDADLSSSTRTALFAKEFPERFFNVGVAEQNMMGVSAGLASCGKTVFVSTFAIFATGRAWDQVRNTICYNNANVKIVATHAGLSVGPDGASHQALEDIALMRVIPNMNIIVPCDGPQTRQAVLAAAKTPGPFYIRLGRPKVPSIENLPEFVFGKPQVLVQGTDITIIACGIMVEAALIAVRNLAQKGIAARVINTPTLKPLEPGSILEAAKETPAFIVCEEHALVGGLASCIAEIVAEHAPVKIASLGIRNRFGQSGDPAALLKEYSLTSEDIEKTALRLLR